MLDQKWTMPLSVEPCTWQKCQAGYQGRETNLETSCSLYYINVSVCFVFYILYYFVYVTSLDHTSFVSALKIVRGNNFLAICEAKK